MYVGLWGNGSLELLDGAQLKGFRAQIGTEDSGVGNALVSGANTRWDIDDYFSVGNKGTGNLRIEDGAVVSVASNSTVVGNTASGSGAAAVSGAGSQLAARGLVVGNYGIGSLLIEQGGLVSAESINVGNVSGASGLVEVKGADSRLTSESTIVVASAGSGTMRVSDGGHVTSSGGLAIVGLQNGSEGLLDVTGAGSRVDLDTPFEIGYTSGSKGELNILDGAAVTSGVGTIGRASGAIGRVLVSGEGSSWEAPEIHLSGTYIGGTGGRSSLTVNNGAVVKSDFIQTSPGSYGYAALNIGSAGGDAATAAGTIDTSYIEMDKNSVVVFNHTDSNYQFNPEIKGAGEVHLYSGVTTLNGNTSYRGATRLEGGTLRAGAAGTFSTASEYIVSESGQLDLGNYSQTIASLRNGGLVSFGDLSRAPRNNLSGTPGALLVVSGNYAGNGGVVEINTRLGSDDSLTDKLVVQGRTSGDSLLKVNNAGGEGDFTYANGIPVVQVEGASNGVFSLANRVVAGNFEYLLAKGGKDNPDDGGWYLRSERPTEPATPVIPVLPDEPVEPVDPVDPFVPVDPVDPVAPVDPVEPVPPVIVGPGPSKPGLYRPEIGAYLGNQLAAISMFRHTLHERAGEQDFSEAQRGEGATPGSVWMRVKRNDFTANTGARQIDVDTSTDILQLGADLVRWTDGDSRYHAGVMAATGKARTDVSSNVLGYKAKGEVEGYSVGVYGTWFQSASEPAGAYVDTWLQFGDYDNSVKGDGLAREKYDSRTWAASVESGYAFEVGQGQGKAYYVEPQAQVIYTDYQADKHKEQNGTVVRSKNSGDVTTRLGARAYVRPTDKSGTRVQPFVEANWWRSEADNAMSFNHTSAKLDGAKNLYEMKVGAEVAMGQGWSAFGQVGKQMSSGDQQDVAGQIGVKYSW